MNRIRSVHIAPTYACNLACPYCYAAKYRGEYESMSFELFAKMLDRVVADGIQRISFIGGEPTIWPHLSRAITAARSLGMQVGLLSNGMLLPEALPDSVMINATNLNDPKLRPTILKNVEKYKKFGVVVGLRFNLNVGDTPALLRKYIGWAEKYAESISFSPTVPYGLDRRLGQTLFEFAKLAKRKIKSVTLNRAVPICIFSPEQLDWLRHECGLYSVCQPGEGAMVINPDGSLLACVDLSFSSKIHKSLSLSEKTKKEIKKLKNIPISPDCSGCQFFPNECQGGCLSMKCKNVKK